MKWLKIDYIKQHSRIDYDCEDSVLELYANGAEDTILYLCNRTYENLIGTYGKVPADIIHASLELCDSSYQHRCPASPQNLSVVPYNFDLLIRNFMCLSGTPLINERNRVLKGFIDQKANLDFFAEGREDETLNELYKRIETLGKKYYDVSRPTDMILVEMRKGLATLEADVQAYLDSLKGNEEEG